LGWQFEIPHNPRDAAVICTGLAPLWRTRFSPFPPLSQSTPAPQKRTHKLPLESTVRPRMGSFRNWGFDDGTG
jgi:hypothetical protein